MSSELVEFQSWPKNDAQALEVALILHVKLRRAAVPHILEEILCYGEYFPALAFEPPVPATSKISTDTRYPIIGILPSQLSTQAAKLHLRINIRWRTCKRPAHGAPEWHPSRRLRIATREEEKPVPIFRHRDPLLLRFRPHETHASAGTLAPDVFVQVGMNFHLEDGQPPVRSLPTSEWIEEIFHVDGGTDPTAYLGKEGLTGQRERLLAGLRPGDVLRVNHAPYSSKIIKACLYIKPRVDYDRLILHEGVGDPLIYSLHCNGSRASSHRLSDSSSTLKRKRE